MKIEIEISDEIFAILVAIGEISKRDASFMAREAVEKWIDGEIEIAKQLVTYINSPDRRIIEKTKRRQASKGLKARVLEKSDGRCTYCGVELKWGGNWHIDHIVPLVRGGVDSYENMAASCPICNIKKSHKPLDEFVLESSRK